MENWQIIVIGTFGGFFLVVLTFKYCFDSLFQRFSASRHENQSTYYTSFRYSSTKKQRLRPDLERFVHEEFESPHHEVVVVVLSNSTKCIGIVAFLQERKVEYFSEKFQACCVQDLSTSDLPSHYNNRRAGLAAVSVWSVKWTLASSVSFLIDDRTFVEACNNSLCDPVISDKVSQFEEKHDFHLACQWTDNFICDIVSICCI